jgi:hypothetical protein
MAPFITAVYRASPVGRSEPNTAAISVLAKTGMDFRSTPSGVYSTINLVAAGQCR